MSSWMDYFDEKRLSSGRDYYEWEEYSNVCRIGDSVVATVYGSDNYTVRIELRDDKVCDMSCTCPYAREGNNCKHMACICYYIENEELKEVEKTEVILDTFNDTIGDDEYKNYLVTKIKSLDKIKLVELLSNIIVNDDEYFLDLLDNFDGLDDTDRLIYKKRLNNILSQKWDLLDYSTFTKLLDNYIDEDLFNLSFMKEYSLLFELIQSILYRLAGIIYLRDTLEFEMIMDNLEFRIDDLVKYDENYIDKINNLFTQIADKYSDMALIDSFTKLFNKYAKEDNSQTKIKLLEKELEKTDYGKIYKIEEIVKLMEESDYSNEETINFLEKYADVEEIEIILSQYYMKTGRTDDAISILYDSCEDYKYSTRSTNALEQLKKIYISRDNPKYIDCIRDLIFKYDNYSKENMLLLKEYYEDDWEKHEKEIITHYKNTSNRNDTYYNYLIDKGEYETFKESILANGNFYDLKHFKKVLMERYPNELLEAYEKMVMETTEEANVKNYKEIVEILKEMKRVPGGNVRVKELVEELKNQYPRRTRMIKELDALQ